MCRLARLLQSLFPEAYAQRLTELQAMTAAVQAAADACAPPAEPAQPATQGAAAVQMLGPAERLQQL